MILTWEILTGIAHLSHLQGLPMETTRGSYSYHFLTFTYDVHCTLDISPDAAVDV